MSHVQDMVWIHKAMNEDAFKLNQKRTICITKAFYQFITSHSDQEHISLIETENHPKDQNIMGFEFSIASNYENHLLLIW